MTQHHEYERISTHDYKTNHQLDSFKIGDWSGLTSPKFWASIFGNALYRKSFQCIIWAVAA